MNFKFIDLFAGIGGLLGIQRHRFGQLYSEKNGELFFKLNLQLRFN